MKARHIPIRTCVACRTTGDKRGLIRIVRSPDGKVQVDPTGKQNGRGAYICYSSRCIQLAQKQKRLERALRAPIPPTILEELIRLAEAHENTTFADVKREG
ncbi:MAG: YlxR family protein [Armatimonadetes bacterium]|nr:YlxR family protein [Armatimonadota bacterium]